MPQVTLEPAPSPMEDLNAGAAASSSPAADKLVTDTRSRSSGREGEPSSPGAELCGGDMPADRVASAGKSTLAPLTIGSSNGRAKIRPLRRAATTGAGLMTRSADWALDHPFGTPAGEQAAGDLQIAKPARRMKLGATRGQKVSMSVDVPALPTLLEPLDMDRTTRRAVRRRLKRGKSAQSLRAKPGLMRSKSVDLEPGSPTARAPADTEEILRLKQWADELRAVREARQRRIVKAEAALSADRASAAHSREARKVELDRLLDEGASK